SDAPASTPADRGGQRRGRLAGRVDGARGARVPARGGPGPTVPAARPPERPSAVRGSAAVRVRRGVRGDRRGAGCVPAGRYGARGARAEETAGGGQCLTSTPTSTPSPYETCSRVTKTDGRETGHVPDPRLPAHGTPGLLLLVPSLPSRRVQEPTDT